MNDFLPDNNDEGLKGPQEPQADSKLVAKSARKLAKAEAKAQAKAAKIAAKQKRASDKFLAKEARAEAKLREKAAAAEERSLGKSSRSQRQSQEDNPFMAGRESRNLPPKQPFNNNPPPVRNQPQNNAYVPLNRSLLDPSRPYPGMNPQSQNQPQQNLNTPPPQNINPQLRYPLPQPKKNKGAKITAIVLAAVVGVALTGGLINGFMKNFPQGDASSPTPPSILDSNTSGGGKNNIILPTNPKPEVSGDEYVDDQGRYTPKGLSKVAAPAVVQIIVYLDNQVLYPSITASGIIISSEGYVLTNAHTFFMEDEVTGANNRLQTQQKIVMDSGEAFEAEITGIDQKLDLAVLKFTPADPATLPVMEIGRSSELEQGDMVAVVSSPAGMRNTLTVGYVSAVDREYALSASQGSVGHYIQVDAAISPGSSGGALVNMFGQLVGVMTWTLKSPADNVYEGLNFAIPIDTALPVAQDLIAKGYVSGRAWLGIQHVAMEAADAQTLKVEAGLLVVSVTPDSPAEMAGIQKDDIITHVEGNRTLTGADLRKFMDGCSPGQVVTVTVCRKDILDNIETLELDVELGELSN